MNNETINMSNDRRYLVLAVIMLGNIMAPIDASIVNVVLPTITKSFNVGISTGQWIPMIYLLTISSMLLFYSRLGDIIGYNKVYLTGLVGFITASLLCGLSPTIYWLITCRAIQGLAAGMMMAVSYAIISSCFPPAERGKAFGIYTTSISAGLALGPSLGGFIAYLLDWHFVFLINIPIGIAALIWGRHIIPEFKGQPSKIDFLGAVTVFIFLFSFLFLINNFQSLGFGYTSMILLLVAVLAGISFLLIETRVKLPLLNLVIFHNVTFLFANIGALLNFMSQYILVFITPFYLNSALQYSPSKIGLIMTSFPLTFMAVSPLSGYLSDRIGTRIPTCLGAAICALSLLFMSQLSSSANSIDIVWRLALFGFGIGIFQSPNNSTVMGNVTITHFGIASGILATIRNLGMVMGIATAGVVLNAFAPYYILQKNAFQPFETTVFLSGLKYAYIVGAILTGLASIASLVRGKGS